MEFIRHALVKLQLAANDDITADAIERVATKSVYAASGVSIVSGLTVNEWGVIVGMILGVATFAFNIWFKMKYQRNKP